MSVKITWPDPQAQLFADLHIGDFFGLHESKDLLVKTCSTAAFSFGASRVTGMALCDRVRPLKAEITIL